MIITWKENAGSACNISSRKIAWVNEVADMVGYEKVSNFIKVFKEFLMAFRQALIKREALPTASDKLYGY